MLIKRNASVNGINLIKETPLQLSLNKETPEYALALIKAKADVNVTDGMLNTPLMIATQQVNIPLMKHLLNAGANVNKGAKTAEQIGSRRLLNVKLLK